MIHSLMELRQKAGMSQYDLAQKLGWDRTRLHRVEALDQCLDLVELHKLCEALGADAASIYQAFVKKLDQPTDA